MHEQHPEIMQNRPRFPWTTKTDQIKLRFHKITPRLQDLHPNKRLSPLQKENKRE